MNLQSKFENAIINFLSLSKVLDKDLEELLRSDDGSDSWKRNFIRTSIALVEGYCYCFREFCQVALEAGTVLSNKRLKAINKENGCSASERIKLTIQSAYEVFELEQSPDFGGQEWCIAEKAINKRSKLMHPKILQDLEMSDSNWQDYLAGITWLIQISSSLIEEVDRKHGE
ncbi:MAG TPA: hypothetical protein VIE65_18535 [Methylobacter sp.]|jgi:hypothetical protein